jgi:NADH-quinone oxidoreductase subunit A
MLDTQFSQLMLFTTVGFLLGATLLTLSITIQRIFGINSPKGAKTQPYECGMNVVHDTKIQYDVKYYLYALMFIVFDVEFVFLVPWASVLDYFTNKTILIVEAFIFVFVLVLGLYYAWTKGVLEFD